MADSSSRGESANLARTQVASLVSRVVDAKSSSILRYMLLFAIKDIKRGEAAVFVVLKSLEQSLPRCFTQPTYDEIGAPLEFCPSFRAEAKAEFIRAKNQGKFESTGLKEFEQFFPRLSSDEVILFELMLPCNKQFEIFEDKEVMILKKKIQAEGFFADFKIVEDEQGKYNMLTKPIRDLLESVPSFYEDDTNDIKVRVSKAVLATSFVLDEAAWKRDGIATHEFKNNSGRAGKDSKKKHESLMPAMSRWAETKLTWVTEIIKKHDKIELEAKKRASPASSSSSTGQRLELPFGKGMPEFAEPEGEGEGMDIDRNEMGEVSLEDSQAR